MKRDFDLMMDHVKKLHGDLIAMNPLTREAVRDCDFPGVYLFIENGKHLYAGRTRNLRRRILQHSNPCVNDAPFAFRLAREMTGNRKASYKPAGSRNELMENPEFRDAYHAAKERIGKMHVRYVRADDAVTQALLEIYSSTLLDTPYNEFKTT